ncbi:MAG: phosphate acyltransferase PlsX [Armatimonadetes bacterium]|nr:phosphate acyltransferase PlsX [Armatimonadota bacterium]
MGGDHAPVEIIKGALEAAPLLKGRLVLVGDEATIRSHLPATIPPNIDIVHASEAVGMDEKPLEAFRKKKNSSIMVGVNLVENGEAGAFVSAGNTGACSSTSLLVWRQIPGIHRPAIASFMPNKHDGFLLLDAGASPDVDPEHLVEFAVMGRAYAERVLGRKNPKVHLLNIGEEPGKGNAFAKQAFTLLEKYEWFKGNIEGKDIFHSECDVVVCDAFVGNIVLKSAEGVAELIIDLIRKEVPESKLKRILYWPVKKVTGPLRKKMDYAEVGGSPLLGLNGITIICHGRSNAKAIRNAILVAERAIQSNLVNSIREAAH